MRCNKAKRIMYPYYYKDFPAKEMTELESHINKCSCCKKEFEEITSLLGNLTPEPIPYRLRPLNAYIAGIYRKMEKKKSLLDILMLRPVVSFATAVSIVIIIFLGIFQYKRYEEQRFIRSNYELIRDMDMFDKMDILRNLDVLESMEENT